MRRNNIVDFAEARILRIFPALIMCCAVCAFILGPIVTSLRPNDYIAQPQTWKYFIGNASLTNIQWFLPGVFEQNVYKGVVNGPLWTLPIELKMYGAMLVLGLGMIPLLHFWQYRARILATMIGAYLLYSFTNQSAEMASHHTASAHPLVAFFLIGALAYLCRRITFISSTLALAFWAALVMARGTPLSIPLYYAALTYSVLVISFDATFKVHSFAKYGDLSYGLYLYGFPVKQTIILVVGAMGAGTLFLIAFPTTLLLAWLSWKCVEAPALAHKGFITRLSRKFHTRRMRPILRSLLEKLGLPRIARWLLG